MTNEPQRQNKRDAQSGRLGVLRRHSSRQYVLLAVLCAIIAWFVWLVGSMFIQNWQQAEKQKAALFWNGYGKLFYEQRGSWDGLQERLLADQYIIAADETLSVLFYDYSKNVQTAQIQGGGDASDERKMAILSNGEIIGYTQTSLVAPSSAYVKLFFATMLLGALMFGSGWYLMRRNQLAVNAATYRAAALMHMHLETEERADNGLSQSRSSAVTEAEADSLVQSALQAVDEIRQRVTRLETVRRSMVADIAHELRTPIAIMRTQLDHAIQEDEPLPIERIVSLHDETLRLTKLVKDLQDLSLAETGHLPLFKSWFSLAQLIADVLETLAIDAEERGVRSFFACDKEITIFADESRMRGIMINLIGNAFRHARTKVSIKLKLEQSDAIVLVEDDGWGMEEEEQQHVFERFYRGRESCKFQSKGSGLGLGLAIVKEYANAHQGSVQVSSRFGEGTTFTLSLPIMAE